LWSVSCRGQHGSHDRLTCDACHELSRRLHFLWLSMYTRTQPVVDCRFIPMTGMPAQSVQTSEPPVGENPKYVTAGMSPQITAGIREMARRICVSPATVPLDCVDARMMLGKSIEGIAEALCQSSVAGMTQMWRRTFENSAASPALTRPICAWVKESSETHRQVVVCTVELWSILFNHHLHQSDHVSVTRAHRLWHSLMDDDDDVYCH
jgi:hypothetical protein